VGSDRFRISSLVTRHESPLFLGDSSEGVTPVPIPNTEVKPLSADGTARETGWESRSLPGLTKPRFDRVEAFLFLQNAQHVRGQLSTVGLYLSKQHLILRRSG
jgi:hypothetical protein